MEKRLIQIEGLTQSHASVHSSAFILLLKESEGKRTLPIVIAHPEAQSIAIELENMKPPRPFTHDLFKSFALAFNIELLEVIIYDLKEGIFYAKLICRKGADGNIIEIDSRTSDAVALAVRFNCPIYTYEFILRLAGSETEQEETPIKEPEPTEIKKQKTNKQTLQELQKKLEEAIEIEDYEGATRLRDEIKRLKNQQ